MWPRKVNRLDTPALKRQCDNIWKGHHPTSYTYLTSDPLLLFCSQKEYQVLPGMAEHDMLTCDSAQAQQLAARPKLCHMTSPLSHVIDMPILALAAEEQEILSLCPRWVYLKAAMLNPIFSSKLVTPLNV